MPAPTRSAIGSVDPDCVDPFGGSLARRVDPQGCRRPALGQIIQTVVSFAVPRAKHDDDPTTTITRGSSAAARAPARILVVDDYPDALAIAVESLEALGYRVAVAHDGGEALPLLRQGEPVDLLFTDVMMPGGINGLDLAHRARPLRPDLKVLLTSGHGDRAGSTDARAVAAFPLLPKPYRFKELAVKISEFLTPPPRRKPTI